MIPYHRYPYAVAECYAKVCLLRNAPISGSQQENLAGEAEELKELEELEELKKTGRFTC